jgi:AraC-like DNA-binding protein
LLDTRDIQGISDGSAVGREKAQSRRYDLFSAIEFTRQSLLRGHIKSGTLSLTEIAPLLGFSSLSALSRWRRKDGDDSLSTAMKQIEPGFWMSDTHYAFDIEIP